MSSIRFLLAGSHRYPEHITKAVIVLLEEADESHRKTMEIGKERGNELWRRRVWRDLGAQTARLRVEAQMLAASADLDFNLIVRDYLRAKLREERMKIIYGSSEKSQSTAGITKKRRIACRQS